LRASPRAPSPRQRPSVSHSPLFNVVESGVSSDERRSRRTATSATELLKASFDDLTSFDSSELAPFQPPVPDSIREDSEEGAPRSKRRSSELQRSSARPSRPLVYAKEEEDFDGG
jgi:hypothetical protein